MKKMEIQVYFDNTDTIFYLNSGTKRLLQNCGRFITISGHFFSTI